MLLRKCTSLILTALLLVSNMGLAFNVHYCGGKIASVSTVFRTEKPCEMPVVIVEKKCCAAQVTFKDDCCKNKKVDLHDSHDDTIIKISPVTVDLLSLPSAVYVPIFSRQIAVQRTVYCDYFSEAHSPPFYQLYSQYIFYA